MTTPDPGKEKRLKDKMLKVADQTIILYQEQVNNLERQNQLLQSENASLKVSLKKAEADTTSVTGLASKFPHLAEYLGQVEKENAELRKAIDSEPELPDDMPDEMWEAIKGDKDAMQECLRITVRLTKEGIRKRALAPRQEEK